MGRFDFAVYEKQGKAEIPIHAIELDGKEHYTEEAVKERDRKKNEMCKAHNLQIIKGKTLMQDGITTSRIF